LSCDGEETICLLVVEPAVPLDRALARVRSILRGERSARRDSVRLAWSFGYSGTREISVLLENVVELPWVRDEDEGVAVLEASDIRAAQRTLKGIDTETLAERISEVTEEDLTADDVRAVTLDDDNETTSGRLIRFMKHLAIAVRRAERIGGSVLLALG
jgi:hypothetical protein